MTNHKSINAFVFGVFMITLIALIFSLASDSSMHINSNKLTSIAIQTIFFATIGIFFVGLFYDNNWIQSAQLIIILALTIYLSKMTNIIIGLSIGALAFGILTFGYRISIRSTSVPSTDYLWMGLKWIIVTVLGAILSKVADKIVTF